MTQEYRDWRAMARSNPEGLKAAGCSVPRSFRELFPIGFRVNREAVRGH